MLTNRLSAGPVLDRAAIRQLEAGILGDLVRPGDPEYEAARRILNAGHDRYPALVVRAKDPADVVQAVNVAREAGLTLAVRSGGHSTAGHSTGDGVLVVDLSRMKGLRIDPARRLAWAEPGLTWGEYAGQAQAYGLATSSGDTASVGLGGLTLGGGIGWMVRKYGLTIDHLEAVELVTAGGDLITASATHHPDLFWALRGGGGNFGIATGFQLRLHPVGTILGGAVFHPLSARTVRAYVDYAASAPEELTTIAAVMKAPPAPFIPEEQVGTPVFGILVCYAGDLEEGERVVAPLRALDRPVSDIIGPRPYPAQFELTAAAAAPGFVHDVRSTYLDALDDDLIETAVEYGFRATSPLAMVQFRVLGGAMARVPADATAFAHRDKPFMLTALNLWEPGDPLAEEYHAWTEALWAQVRPRGAGVYVNFLGDEGDERIREAYPGPTYERLAGIKRRYDPANIFRLNQNIRAAE